MTASSSAELDALPRTASPGTPLTTRQRQVLALIAAGYSNAQIARNLLTTENTIATQVARILRKLDTPNRAAAVNRAWQLGLLPNTDRRTR